MKSYSNFIFTVSKYSIRIIRFNKYPSLTTEVDTFKRPLHHFHVTITLAMQQILEILPASYDVLFHTTYINASVIR